MDLKTLPRVGAPARGGPGYKVLIFGELLKDRVDSPQEFLPFGLGAPLGQETSLPSCSER